VSESNPSKSPGYKNVVALGFVSFFTDVSTEMILGILPIYVVTELKASKAALGLMEGLAELANYVFRLLSGIVSDKIGKRKILVFIGYSFSSVAKPLFAFANTWLDAVVIRTLDRVGKGVRTAPRDALLSQSVKKEEAGKAFGIHRTLDQSGAIIGPLLAFIIVPLLGARTLFLLSFIPAAAALVVLTFFVVDIATPSVKREFFKGAKKVFKGKFLLAIIALSLFSLGSYNFSFIILRAGELGIATFALPLIYMTINITHALAGYPSGVLADKIGRENMLVVSMLVFALSSIMLSLLSGSWVYGVIIALVFGVYQGIYDTVSRAIVPQYVAEEYRGTAYGIYHLVIGLSFLAGISITGYLWDIYGRCLAFTYSAAMSLISAILLATIARK